jgi:hypothetical protein
MSTTINGDTGIIFPDASTQSKAVSQATPFAVTASAIAGAELQLPEATANGVNYVAVKAPNTLAANTTFTLPAADGTNGQFLKTDGTGALAFASVPATTPGGTTGQIQINNAGAFGALSSGTTGQILTSGGAGAAPTFLAQGTTGQVLTSAGSGVAPSFATPNPVPGAFGQFSVAGGLQTNTQNVAVSAALMATPGGWATQATVSYATSAGTFSVPSSIIYSTYYGCWFCLANELVGASLQLGVWSSLDGLTWNLVVFNLRNKTGAAATVNMVRVSVDDSDGRLFLGAIDNSNGIVSVYISSGTNWNTFSNVTLVTPGVTSLDFFEMLYIDTGSTSTSAMVVMFTDATSKFLRTCPPGGSTFTSRLTVNQQGTIKYNRTSGFAVSVTNGFTTAVVMTGNNAQTGWSTVAAAPTGVTQWNAAAVNSSAIMVIAGTDLPRISTNGSTFSDGTAITGGVAAVNSVFHNGTLWVASTNNGTYTNSSATGTGSWTLVNGVMPIRLEQNRARQRHI